MTQDSSNQPKTPASRQQNFDNLTTSELAASFLHLMPSLHRTQPQKQINESLRGEQFIIQYININGINGGSVQPSQLSSEMKISSARVAAALNSLEHKGLIIRRTDSGDRRRILVDLTDEEKAFAEQASKHMVSNVNALFDYLGVDDGRELMRLLNRISEFMQMQHDADSEEN